MAHPGRGRAAGARRLGAPQRQPDARWRYEVREGEVSLTDIRSPRKLTYTSQVLTKAEKERASAAVQEVVEIDPTAVQRQRAGLNSAAPGYLGGTQRPRPDRRSEQDQLARLGQPPLEEPSITWLAALDDARWYMVSSEAQRLLWTRSRTSCPSGASRKWCASCRCVSSDQLDRERALAGRRSGQPVHRRQPRAEPRGDDPTPQGGRGRRGAGPGDGREGRDGPARRARSSPPPTSRSSTCSACATRRPTGGRSARPAPFAFLTMAHAGGVYRRLPDRALPRASAASALIALLVIVTVLAAKVILPTRPLLLYAFPLPAVAMLVATLVDGRLAIVLTALLGVLVGFVAGSSFEAAALALATCVVAAGAVWRRERLQVFFVAGLLRGAGADGGGGGVPACAARRGPPDAGDDRGVLPASTGWSRRCWRSGRPTCWVGSSASRRRCSSWSLPTRPSRCCVAC